MSALSNVIGLDLKQEIWEGEERIYLMSWTEKSEDEYKNAHFSMYGDVAHFLIKAIHLIEKRELPFGIIDLGKEWRFINMQSGYCFVCSHDSHDSVMMMIKWIFDSCEGISDLRVKQLNSNKKIDYQHLYQFGWE